MKMSREEEKQQSGHKVISCKLAVRNQEKMLKRIHLAETIKLAKRVIDNTAI
jgi:hypothetical protein